MERLGADRQGFDSAAGGAVADVAAADDAAAAGAGEVRVTAEAQQSGKVQTADPRLRVRLVTERAEMEALRPMVRAAHEETIFGDIPFSDAKFDKFADRAARDPKRYGVIVAERGGKCCGFLHCAAGEYMMGEGALLTTVLALHVRPEIRSSLLGGKAAVRLVRAVKKWSQARGAERVMFHVTSGLRMRELDRFFRRSGIIRNGGNYACRVN